MQATSERANYFDTLLPHESKNKTSHAESTPPPVNSSSAAVTSGPLVLTTPPGTPTSTSHSTSTHTKHHRYINLHYGAEPTEADEKKTKQSSNGDLTTQQTDLPNATTLLGPPNATPTASPPTSPSHSRSPNANSRKKASRYINLPDIVSNGTPQTQESYFDVLLPKKNIVRERQDLSNEDVMVQVTEASVDPVVEGDESSKPADKQRVSSNETTEVKQNGGCRDSSVIGSERASSISSGSNISLCASPVYENFTVQENGTITMKRTSTHSPSPQPKEEWVLPNRKLQVSKQQKSQSLDYPHVLQSGNPSTAGQDAMSSLPGRLCSMSTYNSSSSPTLPRMSKNTSSYENLVPVHRDKVTYCKDSSKSDSNLVDSGRSGGPVEGTSHYTNIGALKKRESAPPEKGSKDDAMIWMDFSHVPRRPHSEQILDHRRSRSFGNILEELIPSHRRRSNAMSEKKDPTIKEEWRMSQHFRRSRDELSRDSTPETTRKPSLNYVQVSFSSAPEADAQTHNRQRSSGSPAAFKIIGNESKRRVEYVQIDTAATKAVTKTLKERNEELQLKRRMFSNQSVH